MSTLTPIGTNGRAFGTGGVGFGVAASYPAYTTPPYDDSAYTGAVATPTGGNGQGYYGLFSRAESNRTGLWNSYNASPGPPAGTTGGGMYNDNNSAAVFEIHFEGTGFRLWGLQNTQYGSAAVRLDGQAAADCYYYTNSNGMGVVYEVSGLPPGRHVIRFTCYPVPADPNQVCVPQYYQILP